MNSSACTAWVRRCTTRWLARINWASRAASMRRSGTHETLLAYLVRRLLENGANSSFVSRFVDENASIDDLVADPIDPVEQEGSMPTPPFPCRATCTVPSARIPSGLDLSNEDALSLLASELAELAGTAVASARRCLRTAIAMMSRLWTASFPSSTPPTTPIK